MLIITGPLVLCFSRYAGLCALPSSCATGVCVCCCCLFGLFRGVPPLFLWLLQHKQLSDIPNKYTLSFHGFVCSCLNLEPAPLTPLAALSPRTHTERNNTGLDAMSGSAYYLRGAAISQYNVYKHTQECKHKTQHEHTILQQGYALIASEYRRYICRA